MFAQEFCRFDGIFLQCVDSHENNAIGRECEKIALLFMENQDNFLIVDIWIRQ